MISVVVPVYNVEKYIKRCVDSILNQSFKDFELILVDDGSKDSSGDICDEYAKQHENIHVIHQQNQGLSITRNRGTESAAGDFVTYIDSDDLVSDDYLETLYNLIQKYNAEVSCCGFKFFTYQKELEKDHASYSDYCLTGNQAMADMLYGKFHGSSACAILIKASIAKSIQYSPGKFHEDDLISFRYYGAAKNVAITNKPMYFYFQREGSIMHSEYGKIAKDELDAADYIENTCKSISKEVYKASLFKKYTNYISVLFTYPDLKKIDLDTYKKVSSELKRIATHLIFDSKVGKKTKLILLIIKIFGCSTLLALRKIEK